MNGRSALTHGTSGGLLSSMAQTAPGEIGQLSFAVTRLGASGSEGRDAARGAAADGRNQCGSSRKRKVQASTDLHHLLLHSTSGPALDRVVNAGSAKGLRAWQLLVERYDPHIRSRTAGKLEAYERDLALYEQASKRRFQMAYVWRLF